MPSPNRVPSASPGPSVTEHLASRAVERQMAKRRSDYEHDMARIVESTFDLIRRTGTLDPPMRDILAETGLSTQAFYRYFRSKDELMLALLDEGRRRLVATLVRRMQRAARPDEQVQAWIEGVLAQAAEPAAGRTRPWLASERRLSELFPDEQQASVDTLVRLLEDPISTLQGRPDDARGGAVLVYRVTFATLQVHLDGGSRPGAQETGALVAFCLRGLGR
jgi:AcrR family transcriptional regulator